MRSMRTRCHGGSANGNYRVVALTDALRRRKTSAIHGWSALSDGALRTVLDIVGRWVLSALSILGRLDWIDQDALVRYVIDCQDVDHGGISDRPGNMTDVFHTFFGLAALSLLGRSSLPVIDPVYALPANVVGRFAPAAAL